MLSATTASSTTAPPTATSFPFVVERNPPPAGFGPVPAGPRFTGGGGGGAIRVCPIGCAGLVPGAGPTGGTEDKPVGLVYHAVADGVKTEVVKRNFPGDRDRIRHWASQQALDMVRRKLM